MEQPAQATPLPVVGALRIFLSSTSVDLEPYRTRVVELVEEGFRQFAVIMDHFPLQPSLDATAVSLKELRASQVYILLLAWRYGHVPEGQTNGQTLSVTHQEYREACRLGLPCFVFLASEQTDEDFTMFPSSVRDAEHRGQLLAFRNEVQQQQVGYFTSKDELVNTVVAALQEYLRDTGRPGRIPSDLPPRVPSFVGREGEMNHLMATLRQGRNVGLSALVAGLGGVGKSALASGAVWELSQDTTAFPGGIAFARCDGRHGLEELTWVYDQLLAAWGLRMPPETLRTVSTPESHAEVREQKLAEWLGRLLGPALVLLDNVEVDFPLGHLLDHMTPFGIIVLVTARHKPSLASLQLVSLDVLAVDAAVQLFRERYKNRGGVWDTTRDGSAAQIVCERLGCLPLAVELAAVRAAMSRLGVSGVAEGLGQSDVLARLQDLLRSEASVRYSFEQSLALLTPQQQVAFAALGLLDGPDWPRPAVEMLLDALREAAVSEVGSLVPVPPVPVDSASSANANLEHLAALSLVSLIPPSVPSTSGKDATARVRLHPLLHALAAENWARQSLATQRVGRHGLLRGVQAWVEDHRVQDAETFALLEADESLVVGALRAVVEGEEALCVPLDHLGHTALRMVISTAFALTGYLHNGGHWQTGVTVWELALRAARAMGDRRNEGAILGNLGSLMSNLGNVTQAGRFYEEALDINRATGYRAAESANLSALGDLAASQGSYTLARNFYKRALTLKQTIRDHAGEGKVLANLGILAFKEQDYAKARTYLERALAVARELGDSTAEANRLGELAKLALTEGDLVRARAWLNAALALARDSGHRDFLCFIYIQRGELARHDQEWEEAARWLSEAEKLNQQLGSREKEGSILSAKARLARDQDDNLAARQLFTEALARFQMLGEAFETQRIRDELAALESLDASNHGRQREKDKPSHREWWRLTGWDEQRK